MQKLICFNKTQELLIQKSRFVSHLTLSTLSNYNGLFRSLFWIKLLFSGEKYKCSKFKAHVQNQAGPVER